MQVGFFFHSINVTVMRFLTATAVLFLFCVSTMGCGDSNSIENAFKKASKENIQKCCAMYAIFSTLNDYKGPKSKEEMLAFLSSDEQAAIRLKRMSMDPSKLESYMTGRDDEPLEFRWGVDSHPRASSYVVCWEQVGFEGNVQVGVTGGTIVETDDEGELEELKKGVYSTNDTYGQYGQSDE